MISVLVENVWSLLIEREEPFLASGSGCVRALHAGIDAGELGCSWVREEKVFRLSGFVWV